MEQNNQCPRSVAFRGVGLPDGYVSPMSQSRTLDRYLPETIAFKAGVRNFDRTKRTVHAFWRPVLVKKDDTLGIASLHHIIQGVRQLPQLIGAGYQLVES